MWSVTDEMITLHPGKVQIRAAAQESHYLPGNHHASCF